MMQNSPPVQIEAKGLSKFYGAFMAIRNVTFAIPKGQIVAFLGPNGAGKSTTMKILSGFLAASEGTASICGLDVSSQRLEAARHLGYLPENGPLYDDMTPSEHMRFFGEARGLVGDQLKKRMEVVAQQCGLREVWEKPAGKLSRGYRQRVGLAQALLHDPDVLIMDEPTAGLDPNQIRDFRGYIRKLGETKTILMSTHILQEVTAVSDRVLLIHNGTLVFDGTPADLQSKNSLEQTFYELTDFGRVAASSSAGGAA